MSEKSYIFPLYIGTNDITITVQGQIHAFEKEKTAYDNYTGDSVEFVSGKGYIAEDGSIWIYKKEKPKFAQNRFPCFWLEKDFTKRFSCPPENVRSQFNEKRLIALDTDTIASKSDANKVYYNEQEQDDIDNASEIYRPVIRDNDDFLKMIVKTVINEKTINITRLKHVTEQSYSVSNMKAALRGTTKMSVLYFSIWAELLGFDYTVTIMDNGTDTIDPLYNTLVYRSWKNNIKTIDEIAKEEAEKAKRKEEIDNAKKEK